MVISINIRNIKVLFLYYYSCIEPFVRDLFDNKYEILEKIDLYNYGFLKNRYDYTDYEILEIEKLNPVKEENTVCFQYLLQFNVIRCDADLSSLPQKLTLSLSLYLSISSDNVFSQINLLNNNIAEVEIDIIIKNDENVKIIEDKANKYFSENEFGIYIKKLGMDYDNLFLKCCNISKYNDIILHFVNANDVYIIVYFSMQ